MSVHLRTMKLDLVFVSANMSCDAVLQAAVIVCVCQLHGYLVSVLLNRVDVRCSLQEKPCRTGFRSVTDRVSVL